MNQLIRTGYEKLLFVLALAAAGLSVIWLVRQPESRPIQSVEQATRGMADGAYVAADWRLPGPAATEWVAPPPQSKGRDWLYEVFTPPVIYLDAAVGSYTLKPPSQGALSAGEAAGLELLAVRLQPFRLQLHGYFGGPGDYVAAFVSPQTSETLLARPGQRLDALGLVLKSFDVRKVKVGENEAGPAYEIAALAVLLDEASGAEVVLDSRTRRLTDAPVAVVKMPGTAGKLRELLEGASFTAEGWNFRIARIQLDPPEVVVVRTAPHLPGPEPQVLRLATPIAGPAIPPQALASLAATKATLPKEDTSSP